MVNSLTFERLAASLPGMHIYAASVKNSKEQPQLTFLSTWEHNNFRGAGSLAPSTRSLQRGLACITPAGGPKTAGNLGRLSRHLELVDAVGGHQGATRRSRWDCCECAEVPLPTEYFQAASLMLVTFALSRCEPTVAKSFCRLSKSHCATPAASRRFTSSACISRISFSRFAAALSLANAKFCKDWSDADIRNSIGIVTWLTLPRSESSAGREGYCSVNEVSSRYLYGRQPEVLD